MKNLRNDEIYQISGGVECLLNSRNCTKLDVTGGCSIKDVLAVFNQGIPLAKSLIYAKETNSCESAMLNDASIMEYGYPKSIDIWCLASVPLGSIFVDLFCSTCFSLKH